MKNILSLCLCMVSLLACQDTHSQKQSVQKTKQGYNYILAKDAPGEPVKTGQFVLIHSMLMHEDSVLTDTRVNPGRPTLVKVEPEGNRRGGSGPVQGLLELLSVGDSARFFYPIDSFPTVPPRLQGMKEVIYDIVVLDIFETEEEMQAFMDAERERIQAPIREAQAREQQVAAWTQTFWQEYKAGKKDNQWISTPSGLKYIIIEKSPVKRKAAQGEVIRPHYYGFFESTGEHFDNSFKRGQTYDFPLGTGSVIQGWHEGFAVLDKGDKAVFMIPPSLAYGEQGHPAGIPPNSTLFFYVELVGIGEED
jgi:FKBP-type peptidyl-prolyl cis-trans isomerase